MWRQGCRLSALLDAVPETKEKETANAAIASHLESNPWVGTRGARADDAVERQLIDRGDNARVT